MPDTPVSPSSPLVPFKLPPQCWSSGQWVWVGESVCGFFKRNCLGFQQFLPPTQSLLLFADRSCGDLSSYHWSPGLGGLVWSWDSSLLRHPSQIFIHPVWGWQAYSMSASLPPVCIDVVSSIVVRLPFSSISDSSEWWMFYISVVILMWLCEEVSHVCLHHHLDQKF